MTCLGRGCGLVFELAWQPPPVRAEVIRLLAGWPLGNRCWDAHKGETLDELKLQGILMLGVGVAERNGLMVAENITMPDDLTSPTDYLERLRATRAKAAP
jgi:hypothetical protein